VNGPLYFLEKVARATVTIHAEVPQEHPSVAMGLGNDRRGTGTLVSGDGLILTVNYVIIGARNVMVTLATGEQLPARIVARDFTTSLGLLQIEGSDYPRVEVVSSASAQLGQDVFIVSSLGGEKRCADTGFVTYLGPYEAAWEFALERCVCISAAALNVGLSGGPICNSAGQIVAISYLNLPDLVRPILGIPGECFLSGRDELVQHGHRISTPRRLWIGLMSYTLREHVVITSVMPGSPCEKAGLREGDLVLSADGCEIHERKALYEAINRHQPGENVQLRILRNNQVHELAVSAVAVDDYLG
jgi:S1-C subfamily serine protease